MCGHGADHDAPALALPFSYESRVASDKMKAIKISRKLRYFRAAAVVVPCFSSEYSKTQLTTNHKQ